MGCPQAFSQLSSVQLGNTEKLSSRGHLAKDQTGLQRSVPCHPTSGIQMWVTIFHSVGHGVWSQTARFESVSIVSVCVSSSKLVSLSLANLPYL